METAKFRIDNAKHFELTDIEISPDTGVDLLGSPTQSSGVYTLNFKTPTDRKAYPLGIKVTSTSKNLEPVIPARSGDLLILTKTDLTITPAGICVEANEKQKFTAEIKNGPPDPVLKWEIISGPGELAGDTDTDDVYTAPSAANGETVTLRATLTGEDDVDDTITFRVGPCVGVSAFYDFTASIRFPWGGQNCGNNINQEVSEDTITAEVTDVSTQAPANTLWSPGQQFIFDKQLANSQFCSGANLPASVSNRSELILNAAGNSLDINFDVLTSAICDVPGGQTVQNQQVAAVCLLASR
ncbi:TPA: hypothetical protein EYP38_04230 [Candidatus Micrarchaeota archaeon]|nr:hypothetical protein [Candidatus Micrarchaeota archaeon]